MGNSRTVAEAKQDRVRVLGQESGAVYDALVQEVTWLHAKWSQYKQLFGTSKERIDVLNRVAGRLFRVVQDTLFEDVVLHIARLVDRPDTSGKTNLSIQQLDRLLSGEPVSGELNALVTSAKTASAFATGWRNRHLAHRDLALSVATPTDPLQGINRTDVDKALLAIAATLNKVEDVYFKNYFDYSVDPIGPTDVNRLTRALQSFLDQRST